MAEKKQPKKTTAKQLKKPSPKSIRQVKPQGYKSFRLSKRIKHTGPVLPGAFKLFKLSIKQLFAHKKLFFGIVGVYLVLTIVLVKGLGLNSNVPELKSSLEDLSTNSSELISGVAIFSFLVGTASNPSSDAAGVYQAILLIVVSLAFIWALRQVHAKSEVSVRDAFYKGLYPLVPFVLILGVISLQMLPLIIGSGLHSLVSANGLAVGFIEQAFWAAALGLFALLSLYMITSSLFALYIVTLPDVRPMQALRSARGLVRYRRWAVMRRVLLLPVMLLLAGAIIIIPLIIFMAPVAEWVFFVLSMLTLAIVHSYLYNLYRELL